MLPVGGLKPLLLARLDGQDLLLSSICLHRRHLIFPWDCCPLITFIFLFNFGLATLGQRSMVVVEIHLLWANHFDLEEV